jgi:hypothetical protein
MSKFYFIRSSSIKSLACAAVFALTLLSFIAPRPTAAQTGGPSADGSFSFTLEDGLTKTIEFRAITNTDGSTSGSMVFKGPVEIPDQDVDGTGDKSFSGRVEDIAIEANFDGLVVDRNRAVMSGVITGSTIGEYIGKRVLLVVEDNGDGIKGDVGDRFVWGLYKFVARDWIPSDAEWKDDPGSRLTWIATDAERRDDQGIPMPKKDEPVNTQSFPLSSYDFASPVDATGNINVLP